MTDAKEPAAIAALREVVHPTSVGTVPIVYGDILQAWDTLTRERDEARRERDAARKVTDAQRDRAWKAFVLSLCVEDSDMYNEAVESCMVELDDPHIEESSIFAALTAALSEATP